MYANRVGPVSVDGCEGQGVGEGLSTGGIAEYHGCVGVVCRWVRGGPAWGAGSMSMVRIPSAHSSLEVRPEQGVGGQGGDNDEGCGS